MPSCRPSKCPDRLLAGLRLLSDSQRPGTTLSASEIARALHCDEGTIRYIERCALKKVAGGLRACDPALVTDYLKGRTFEGLLAGAPVRVVEKRTAKDRVADYRARINADPKKKARALAKRRSAWAARKTLRLAA